MNNILFAIITIIPNSMTLITNSLHNRLALEVLKTKASTNAVVSPLAVRLPLCKLASVAEGDAKAELLSILGYNRATYVTTCYTEIKEVMTLLKQAELTYVNKIYVNYTEDIKTEFITNSSEMYGVQVDKVGFNYPSSAVAYINRWVDTATYRRIRDVIENKDIDKNTTMILISAAHFKGTWEFPFDVKLTTNKKFHHLDKKITTIPMMSKTGDFLYFEDNANGFEMLTIKLGTWSTSITFVSPLMGQNLPDLLDQIYNDQNLLRTARSRMKYTYLNVFLPRLKIKTYVDWTDYLKLIGLKKIFNNTSSGLNSILKENSESRSVCLNKVKQRVFLELDELGLIGRFINSAIPLRIAVDPTLGTGLGGRPFVLDKPFYFIITVELGNFSHDLFNGVYYGPE